MQISITKVKYSSFKNNKEIDLLLPFEDYDNFNNILEFPDATFIDDNHLNSEVVKLYNSNFHKILSTYFK